MRGGWGGPGILIFLCFFGNHVCTENIQKCYETYDIIILKNTIKAGGSTIRAQNVDWVMDGWSGWSGYPLDCYDY